LTLRANLKIEYKNAHVDQRNQADADTISQANTHFDMGCATV